MMKPFGFLGGKDKTFLAEGFVLSAMTILLSRKTLVLRRQKVGFGGAGGGSWRAGIWVLRCKAMGGYVEMWVRRWVSPKVG